MITLDETIRAGRMLAAGRVTVTFRSPTGNHITLTAKCRAPREDGRWESCRAADAKVIFIEVPNQGAWNDRVAKVTRAKGLVEDPAADPARTWCARQLLKFVAGEPLAPGLEAFEESACGRCGRALTDPVSIERGIGPECYERGTGSQHQVKAKRSRASRYVNDGGGTDKRGVHLGEGDWRQRGEIARTVLDGERATAKEERPCSQMSQLPGESWEDIFRSQASKLGLEL